MYVCTHVDVDVSICLCGPLFGLLLPRLQTHYMDPKPARQQMKSTDYLHRRCIMNLKRSQKALLMGFTCNDIHTEVYVYIYIYIHIHI